MRRPIQTTPEAHGPQQTFLEHIYELRKRLFIVALVLVAGTLLGYSLHDWLVHFLVAPLGGQKLVYLTPGGGFDFIFKVSLYLGAAFAIPVLIYQLYRYLIPLMRGRHSRQMTSLVIILSLLLALGGMAFGYFVGLPSALKFLTSFGGDYIQASLTASSYLNFVMAYTLGMALLFQLPLVLMFINTINGPFKPSQLFATQKYVLLGVFILAAVITPTPDIANQTIVAGPVLGVYQLGVGLVLWQNRNRATSPQAARQKAVMTAKNAGFVHPHPVKPRPVRSASTVLRQPAPAALRPSPLMDMRMPAVQRQPLPQPAVQSAVRAPRPVRVPQRPIRSIDGVIAMQRS